MEKADWARLHDQGKTGTANNEISTDTRVGLPYIERRGARTGGDFTVRVIGYRTSN